MTTTFRLQSSDKSHGDLMSKVIIYTQDNGNLAVVYPTQEAIDKMGIDAIAAKDVPTGKPYKIVEVTEIPEQREERNTLLIKEGDRIDGVGK